MTRPGSWYIYRFDLQEILYEQLLILHKRTSFFRKIIFHDGYKVDMDT